MNRVFAAAVAAVAGLCASHCFAGGVIVDGDAAMLIGPSNSIGSNAYPNSAPNGEGNLVTDTGVAGATGFTNDVLARNIWYYRASNVAGTTNTFTRIMSNNTSPTGESYVGNTGRYAYQDLFLGNATLPRLNVNFTVTIQDGAAINTVNVIQQVTLVNTGTSSVVLRLFNVAAMSLLGNGLAGNDSISFVNSDPTYIRTTDGSNFAEFRGFDATKGQAGAAASSSIFGLFPTGSLPISTGVTTTELNNGNSLSGGATSIFGTAGALQWTLTLAPNVPQTIYSVISVNQTATVPEPTALGLLAPVGMMLARRRRA